MLSAPSFAKSVFIYTLVFIAFTFFFFTDFYLHPGYFFNFTGDGIKNNSTYLFHVIHDTSWWHYMGMNYPYGENIIYTDCQPVIAQAVKALCIWFPGVKGYEMVLFNLSMFFTWWLGGIALLLLFTRMQLAVGWALLFASSIILMNPQINKLLCGHYGLSHPLLPFLFLWWHSLYTLEKNKWLNYLKITLLLSVMAFIHVYQLAYGLLVTGIFSCCFVFKWKEWSIRIFQLFKLISIQWFVPLLLVWMANYMAVYLTDRPEAPSRFFIDSATLYSVFLHPFSALGTAIYTFLGVNPDPNHEVHVYGGLLSLVYLLLFLTIFILSFFKIAKTYWFNRNTYQTALLVISVVSLCIAMGLPFAKTGLNHWYYYTGYFRQFRSIGRFAVVFYFAIHILGVSWLSQQWAKPFEGSKKWLLMSIFAGIMLADMFLFLEAIKFYPKKSEGFVQAPNEFKQLKLDKNNFQAIITNPFFHVGSENCMYFDKKDALRQSLQLSVQTGIPLVNSMLSRSSLHQTIKCSQLAQSLFKYPELLKQLPSNKPFILLESKGIGGESHFSLDRISARLPIIYESNTLVLKRLDLVQFEKEYNIMSDSVQKLLQKDIEFKRNKSSNIYPWVGEFKPLESYKVSFEMSKYAGSLLMISLRFKTRNIGSNCVLTQVDKHGETISTYAEFIGNWIEQIDENESMIRIPVYVASNAAILNVELINKEFDICYLVKKVLVQKVNSHHFYNDGKFWYYNNYKTNIKLSFQTEISR